MTHKFQLGDKVWITPQGRLGEVSRISKDNLISVKWNKWRYPHDYAYYDANQLLLVLTGVDKIGEIL